MSQFLKSIKTRRGSAKTWNGAASHMSSGSDLLDYFSKCGTYSGRSEGEVSADMASIFSENKALAMKMVLYNRMITRKCNGFVDQTDLQKGQGRKDEFIKSVAWIEFNDPLLLYKNLWLIPEVGRWSDLWYDSPSTGFYYYVNEEKVYSLIKEGLSNEKHRALIAKYLPQIRSNSKVKNDRHRRLNKWARGLCSFLGWSERDYRKFKSNPDNQAHQFQRDMCSNRWNELNFSNIPGKALFQLTNKTGKDKKTPIARHNLDKKYLQWIKKQPVAKFTGYPFELYKAARGESVGWSWSKPNRTAIQTHTLNKQFDGLIKKAQEDGGSLLDRGVLCAIDTSSSMTSRVQGNTTALDVCCGLGIYFSKLLKGRFKDHVIGFSDRSNLVQLKGNFCDRVDQLTINTYMGSTNFQSVIDEIVRVRKTEPSIPIEEFPEVLLVVSDMQFNPSGGYSWNYRRDRGQELTNYETAKKKLAAVGLPEMTIIWWHVNGDAKDVPSTMNDAGTVLISGFDGAIINAVLSTEDVVENGVRRKPTPQEVMLTALDQSILNAIEV